MLLSGPLGAGKTALAQGIGAGLGVAGDVTSPTFVIARVHRPDPARGGRLPMVHVDAYRLGAAADPRAEVDDLDLDASLDDSVTVVEWGEGMVEQLAEAHLRVRIDRRDDDTRVVELGPYGGDWAAARWRAMSVDLLALLPAAGGTLLAPHLDPAVTAALGDVRRRRVRPPRGVPAARRSVRRVPALPARALPGADPRPGPVPRSGPGTRAELQRPRRRAGPAVAAQRLQGAAPPTSAVRPRPAAI